MKLSLTTYEATELIRKALNVPAGEVFTIEIVTDCHPLTIALRQSLVEFPDFRSSQKISAIKRFRDLAPKTRGEDYRGAEVFVSVVGLADAKFAVENPEKTFANIAKNGRIQ